MIALMHLAFIKKRHQDTREAVFQQFHIANKNHTAVKLLLTLLLNINTAAHLSLR